MRLHGDRDRLFRRNLDEEGHLDPENKRHMAFVLAMTKAFNRVDRRKARRLLRKRGKGYTKK